MIIHQYFSRFTFEPDFRSIWVVGSSIVKHAFIHARRSYDGCNLGLKRHNCRVWWQGKSGMTLGELNPRISYLLQFENTPDILVIHCGGNSIGQIPLHHLRRQIRETILQLEKILPSTKLIWSQILPRYNWRYSENAKAMNFAAARLNNYAAWLICQLGGHYIKYTELWWDAHGIFSNDGVHLSDFGK